MFLVISTVEVAVAGNSCMKLHCRLSASETMIVSNLTYSVTLKAMSHLVLDFLYLAISFKSLWIFYICFSGYFHVLVACEKISLSYHPITIQISNVIIVESLYHMGFWV